MYGFTKLYKKGKKMFFEKILNFQIGKKDIINFLYIFFLSFVFKIIRFDFLLSPFTKKKGKTPS